MPDANKSPGTILGGKKMDNMKRFRIEFSGQGYPEYRPSSVTMWSQDVATAEQWARKQLGAWGIDVPSIKSSVAEVKEEVPAPAPVVDQEKKPKKPKDKRPTTKKARKAVTDPSLVSA